MDKEVREMLINIARSGKTMSYSQLNDQLQLGLDFSFAAHRVLIGDILEDISLHEHKKNRPLLSSLIVRKGSDSAQGDGFFKLCEDIYQEDWEVLKKKKSFKNEKMIECSNFWQNDDNYSKFKND